MASRLESKGEIGRIHISSATRDLIGSAFHCTSRGLVQLKGLGEHETFLVDLPGLGGEIAPELKELPTLVANVGLPEIATLTQMHEVARGEFCAALMVTRSSRTSAATTGRLRSGSPSQNRHRGKKLSVVHPLTEDRLSSGEVGYSSDFPLSHHFRANQGELGLGSGASSNSP